MRLSGAKSSTNAAETLRPLLYGDRLIEQWPDQAGDHNHDPWASFVAARDLYHQGREAEAAAIWTRIAEAPGLESRHTLQAWHFLRTIGTTPPPDVAPEVLAAVAEVAVGGGHDLLIAYRDGSVRYLNHRGKVAIVESQAATSGITTTATDWLEIATVLANVVGIWEHPDLPPLPAGHTRILMLTPGGKRFGQGPDAELGLDASAHAYLSAATKVLHSVVDLAV